MLKDTCPPAASEESSSPRNPGPGNPRTVLIKWAYARAHKQQSTIDATNMVVIMLRIERG